LNNSPILIDLNKPILTELTAICTGEEPCDSRESKRKTEDLINHATDNSSVWKETLEQWRCLSKSLDLPEDYEESVYWLADTVFEYAWSFDCGPKSDLSKVNPLGYPDWSDLSMYSTSTRQSSLRSPREGCEKG